MTRDGHLDLTRLTPQQRRVLRLILQNRTPKEAALELEISVRTVYDHMQQVYRRFDMRSQTDLLWRSREHWDCCGIDSFSASAGTGPQNSREARSSA